MPERERRSSGSVLGVAVALAGLAGCGNADLGLSSFGLPGHDPHFCYNESWGVRADFTAEQTPEPPPDQLQVATLRVGEVVGLEVEPWSSGVCDGAVVRVDWITSRPDVASITPVDDLAAELRAEGRGESIVSAEVILTDGQRKRAEVHSGPFNLIRVYAIRVLS
jgi:hypothetical protein